MPQVVGGLILVGIPCSCLLSFWARRRLELIRALDLEQAEGRGAPETTEHSRHLMKETDLDLFPVKPYRRKSALSQQTIAAVDSVDAAPSQSTTLPGTVHQLSSSTLVDDGEAGADICPICIESFNEDEPIRELIPCQHYFHSACIEPWLTKRNGVCPLCRICLWNLTEEIDLTDVRDARPSLPAAPRRNSSADTTISISEEGRRRAALDNVIPRLWELA
ncbi:hypothetical protein DFJ77DRAFT_292048 [Powellomyces hirtus]|nr:hypothetical protein DFJ77DRAFT_292048 [Powellomyces hirtus]